MAVAVPIEVLEMLSSSWRLLHDAGDELYALRSVVRHLAQGWDLVPGEGQGDAYWRRVANGKVEKARCSDDELAAFAEALANTDPPPQLTVPAIIERLLKTDD